MFKSNFGLAISVNGVVLSEMSADAPDDAVVALPHGANFELVMSNLSERLYSRIDIKINGEEVGAWISQSPNSEADVLERPQHWHGEEPYQKFIFYGIGSPEAKALG